MKKIVLIVCTFALVFAPLFAAPTEEEVGQTLEGVMMVYAAVLMGAMFGASPEGAEMKMDMETGASSLVCDDLDVSKLFSEENTLGAMMMAGGEDMPEIAFTRMSGTITASEEGELDLDVTLKGGPVKNLVLIMEDEDTISLKADGLNYSHLASDPDFMLKED